MPPDRNVALLGRERAVLCGVGGELMEHYCHCLTGFRAQYDLGATDSGIVVCGIGCKLVLNKLCQRYPLPATGAQKLLCCCHRANASVKRRYEIGHRSTTNRRLGNDGADGREGVLDAMVELRNQHALAFFSTFAFRYVDVDTNHALRTPVFIIRNRTASLDPSNLAVGEDNAVLTLVLLPQIGKSLVTRPFRQAKIVGVHSCPPFAI